MPFFIMDIWHAVHAILTSADWITLGIMAVIALGAGFMMASFGSLLSTTVVALIAFGLAGYVRAVTLGGQKAAAYAATDWQAFQNLHMLDLLAYALIFAVVIAVVHAVRMLAFGR